MKRREALAGAFGLTVATSGCIGVLTGSEALTREASPASVGQSTLSATDYELKNSESQRIERTVEVAGQTRDVVAVNKVDQYHKALSLPVLGDVEAAVFAAVSTPAFDIAGQTMSPVKRMSNKELAKLMQQQYSDFSIGSKVGDDTVTTLGKSMTVSKFEAKASLQGEAMDVYLHVGKVKHGSDFVIVVGVYPQQFEEEQENVVSLIGGLEHEK